MSERSQRQVLELIDQAAQAAPAMHAEPDRIIAGGKRRIQRRRAVGAGAAVGVAAVAGGIWLATDSGWFTAGQDPIPPAAPTQEPAPTDAVDPTETQPTTPPEQITAPVGPDPADLLNGELFAGLSTLSGPVDYTAALVQEDPAEPVYLELSDLDGAPVATIEGDTPVDGLHVFYDDLIAVAVWEQPADTTGFAYAEGIGFDELTQQIDTTQVGEVNVGLHLWMPSEAEGSQMFPEPGQVQDAYVLDQGRATMLSGEEIDGVELRLPDQGLDEEHESIWVFLDPARDHVFTDVPSAVQLTASEELVHLPVVAGDIEFGVHLWVLPEGASDVDAINTDGYQVQIDTAELEERPVVYFTYSGSQQGPNSPGLQFELDGEVHEALEYLAQWQNPA